jgi:catechol 2,3-dioxygenase-like lactoylglutathione lyase family enzyme
MEFAHIGFAVQDVQKSKDFYSKALFVLDPENHNVEAVYRG